MGFGGGRGGSTRRSKSWRCFGLTGFPRAIPDYLAVNAQLTQHVVSHTAWEARRRENTRPEMSLMAAAYGVPNDELLNGLILGHASGTVGAANRAGTAAALGTHHCSLFSWSP